MLCLSTMRLPLLTSSSARSFVIDTWQFFLHKAMHEVPYLYRNFHSHHHRLYVPYAFGALYNHPVEGFLLDSVGAALAEAVAGMTVRQTILLFGFSSAKTVDDHSGYRIWWDPMQVCPVPGNALNHL
jgi:sphinganine C4-monooxygenase